MGAGPVDTRSDRPDGTGGRYLSYARNGVCQNTLSRRTPWHQPDVRTSTEATTEPRTHSAPIRQRRGENGATSACPVGPTIANNESPSECAKPAPSLRSRENSGAPNTFKVPVTGRNSTKSIESVKVCAWNTMVDHHLMPHME